MNRPDKANYMTIEINPFVMGLDEATYRKDLEKYCDELEREKDFVNKVVIPDYHLVLERLAKTKKALDNACDNLEVLSTCEVFPNIKAKQQWKDYCLKKATE